MAFVANHQTRAVNPGADRGFETEHYLGIPLAAEFYFCMDVLFIGANRRVNGPAIDGSTEIPDAQRDLGRKSDGDGRPALVNLQADSRPRMFHLEGQRGAPDLQILDRDTGPTGLQVRRPVELRAVRVGLHAEYATQ
jgi:hypothetical protein